MNELFWITPFYSDEKITFIVRVNVFVIVGDVRTSLVLSIEAIFMVRIPLNTNNHKHTYTHTETVSLLCVA